MALTRDEFVTEICDAIGKRVSASFISGATLNTKVQTYLNWAQLRIARFYSFPELNALLTTSATVADVKIYPLTTGTNNLGLTRPKDITTIRLVDSEYSRKLDRWSVRKFDTKYPRPANYATGRPSIYVRDGNSLEFFRIPNDAYSLSIRYPQWPTPFSTGAQASDFENKDQLLVTAGIFETLFALEEYDGAKIWYSRFIGQLKDAVRAIGDVDWEPQAEPFGGGGYMSGEPWIDPYGNSEDPLYGYPE